MSGIDSSSNSSEDEIQEELLRLKAKYQELKEELESIDANVEKVLGDETTSTQGVLEDCDPGPGPSQKKVTFNPKHRVRKLRPGWLGLKVPESVGPTPEKGILKKPSDGKKEEKNQTSVTQEPDKEEEKPSGSQE